MRNVIACVILVATVFVVGACASPAPGPAMGPSAAMRPSTPQQREEAVMPAPAGRVVLQGSGNHMRWVRVEGPRRSWILQPSNKRVLIVDARQGHTLHDVELPGEPSALGIDVTGRYLCVTLGLHLNARAEVAVWDVVEQRLLWRRPIKSRGKEVLVARQRCHVRYSEASPRILQTFDLLTGEPRGGAHAVDERIYKQRRFWAHSPDGRWVLASAWSLIPKVPPGGYTLLSAETGEEVAGFGARCARFRPDGNIEITPLHATAQRRWRLATTGIDLLAGECRLPERLAHEAGWSQFEARVTSDGSALHVGSDHGVFIFGLDVLSLARRVVVPPEQGELHWTKWHLLADDEVWHIADGTHHRWRLPAGEALPLLSFPCKKPEAISRNPLGFLFMCPGSQATLVSPDQPGAMRRLGKLPLFLMYRQWFRNGDRTLIYSLDEEKGISVVDFESKKARWFRRSVRDRAGDGGLIQTGPVSPDGTLVPVFHLYSDQIFLLDAGTGKERARLTMSRPTTTGTDFGWQPDGRELYILHRAVHDGEGTSRSDDFLSIVWIAEDGTLTGVEERGDLYYDSGFRLEFDPLMRFVYSFFDFGGLALLALDGTPLFRLGTFGSGTWILADTGEFACDGEGCEALRCTVGMKSHPVDHPACERLRRESFTLPARAP